MAEVLIVLGMHRSGTSAIAGVLTKMGGSPPRTLYPGDYGNERGYFESAPIMAFHDELLASAGTHWCDWKAFDPAWHHSPACDAYNDRAKMLFEDEFGDTTLAIFKDPRICRFLPFWLDVFAEMDIAAYIVMPVRSPLEVANSLNKRNNLSLPEGILLWLRHVLEAEAASRALSRSIVMWREFISDWRTATDKISRNIGLSWPCLSEETEGEIEGFLRADLLHNTTTDAELAACADIPEWAMETYESLGELERKPQSPEALARLDRIRECFDQSSSLFGRLLTDAETKGQQVAGRAASVQAELSAAKLQLDATMTENAKLEASLVLNRSQTDALTLKLAAADAQATANADAVSRLAKENQTLKQQQNLANHAAAELRARARSDAERQNEALNTLRVKLVDAEAAIAYLERRSARRILPSARIRSALHKRKLTTRLVRSGLFDSAWYLAEYKEVERTGLAPAEHYLEQGFRKGYLPNPFFDTRWYLERYEDVRCSGVNPLVHYMCNGHREGRDPGPMFQASWYLEANPDVRASGMSPLEHFLRFGRAEGRSPAPRC